MNRVIFLILVCFSSVSQSRESKLEKEQQKTHFWGLVSSEGVFESYIDRPPMSQNAAIASFYLDDAQKHFSAISAKFGDRQKSFLMSFDAAKKLLAEGKSLEARNLAHQLEANILDDLAAGFSPVETPSYKFGKSMYEAHCAACHGVNGRSDGVLSQKLTRAPASFASEWRDKSLTPLHTYGVIVHGVEGTEMPSMTEVLESNSMWSVAFYVSTLRWDSPEDLKWNCSPSDFSQLSMETLVRNSNRELESQFGSTNRDCRYVPAFARSKLAFDRSIKREALSSEAFSRAKTWRAVAMMGTMVVLVSGGLVLLLRRSSRIK